MDDRAHRAADAELVLVPLDAPAANPPGEVVEDVRVATISRGPRRRPGRRLQVALGVVAIGAAVAGVVAKIGDGPATNAAPPPPRWFALASTPAGRSVFVVEHDASGPDGAVTYFGDPDADDPFAADDLVVMVQTGAGGDAAPAGQYADPVGVRGTTGGFVDLGPGRADVPIALTFVEADRRVQAMTRHLGRSGLVEAVARLAFADDGSVTLTGDERGLRPVGGPRAFGVPLPIATHGSSRLAQYLSPAAPTASRPNDFLVVSSFAGDVDSLRLARFWGAQPTRVRGHDGVVLGGDADALAYRTLLWQLPDRTIVSIAGTGSEAELAAYADQVREFDADAWRALGSFPDGSTATTAARLPEPEPGPRGTVPPAPLPDDASLPSVLVGADGTLEGFAWEFEDRDRVGCLIVRERRSCIELGDPDDGPGRFVAVTAGDRRVVAFVTAVDVMQVVVEPPGRPPIGFRAGQTLTNGRRVFIGFTPAPASAVQREPVWAPVTVRSADGRATVSEQDVAVLVG